MRGSVSTATEMLNVFTVMHQDILFYCTPYHLPPYFLVYEIKEKILIGYFFRILSDGLNKNTTFLLLNALLAPII